MENENINLNLALKRVIKITKAAYKKALKLKHENTIEKKELNDIVSVIDKEMEKDMVGFLSFYYPTHSFIGEEFGEKINNSEFDWLIDPIDGTINFVSGIPLYGTSVALRKNKETILGVIFDWENNDIYYAIKGKGAFKNKEKLNVSKNHLLKDSIITFCLTSHYNETHTSQIINVIEKLSPNVRGLRLIVCSTTELAWLASGKTDGMVNIKPSIGLSSCAGKLIVQEAGGKVSNIEGQPRKEKDTLLITNGLIHNEIIKLLK